MRRRPCGRAPRSRTFQSTHSLRSATRKRRDPEPDLRFQSTHSLRSATRRNTRAAMGKQFQSTHSLRSATRLSALSSLLWRVSIHALLAECDSGFPFNSEDNAGFNPRTPCGVRQDKGQKAIAVFVVSIHALLAECDPCMTRKQGNVICFNPRTPCGVRLTTCILSAYHSMFQSTHSLRSATAPNLIHCYSTKQIILCANLPKKTVIARLLFLSIYLSIFYSQCITPIADLPGNSCELEVGAQAMFNSL